MSKFKPNDFKVDQEEGDGKQIRVFKLDSGGAPQVEQFSFGKLKQPGQGNYDAVKTKYGALAATDTERSARTLKDSRFTLNPLVREPLSIVEEERRHIEEKIREQIDSISEIAMMKGKMEGYEEGLNKGYAEAFKRFQKEGNDRILKFESMILECEAAKQEIFKANERFLMEVIFRIVRMITLKEISMDKEYPLRLAREVIERLGVRDNITIRLNPEEFQTAELLKEGLEKSLGTLKNLHIESSNQVSRGGCMVETDWSIVDATIDTQLEGVLEALIPKDENKGKDETFGT